MPLFSKIGKEKREALYKLIQSEEKYRAIMERVSDAFVAIDQHWCYTHVNKEAGEILDRKPADLVGKNVWEEFPEGAKEKEKTFIINFNLKAKRMSVWKINLILKPTPRPDFFCQF